jgi:hypothetical protein
MAGNPFGAAQCHLCPLCPGDISVTNDLHRRTGQDHDGPDLYFLVELRGFEPLTPSMRMRVRASAPDRTRQGGGVVGHVQSIPRQRPSTVPVNPASRPNSTLRVWSRQRTATNINGQSLGQTITPLPYLWPGWPDSRSGTRAGPLARAAGAEFVRMTAGTPRVQFTRACA